MPWTIQLQNARTNTNAIEQSVASDRVHNLMVFSIENYYNFRLNFYGLILVLAQCWILSIRDIVGSAQRVLFCICSSKNSILYLSLTIKIISNIRCCTTEALLLNYFQQRFWSWLKDSAKCVMNWFEQIQIKWTWLMHKYIFLSPIIICRYDEL